jgi:tetraacyldisaccharide 4'-kinase
LVARRWNGAGPRLAERAYGRLASARLTKPLSFPSGRTVIAVGGATLGGSGKTPLAMAVAREVERAGARAAIVGHAYRAAPGRARLVTPDDAVLEVGDEALACARAGLTVAVAPSRQAALDLALAAADIAILDGVHQTAPRRASLALLAVDPDHPWGRAEACPPRGDLRAPKDALIALADHIVRVHARSRGVWDREALVPWSTLARARVGLLTALARPDRVARMLRGHGVLPLVIRTFPDHSHVPTPARARPGGVVVDLWLATAKCAASLTRSGPRGPVAWSGERVLVIDHDPWSPDLPRLLVPAALDPRGGGSYARKDQLNFLSIMVHAPEEKA